MGKRCRYGDANPWLTIVGVVGDVRQMSLEATPPMQIYRPLWQTGANSVSVVARTSLAPDRLASDMRAIDVYKRQMYWEPAKYVARLRSLKTNDTPLLLKIKMEPAGHGGASGRYDRMKDQAFEYAWLLTQVGIAK